MIKLENEELGYYTLGFLYIRINSNEDLRDLNKVTTDNPKVLATFFHEYVHFLQNFTTTNGLYSSVFYLQFLKHLVNQIKSSYNNEISLPLEINNEFNRKSQNELNSLYLGKTGAQEDRVIYQYYRTEKILIEDIYTSDFIEPTKYIVTYINCKNNKYEDYHFGTIALKEFIAQNIQRRLFDSAHPDIPYLISELIINKELPELIDYDDLKVVLCDASLMNLHPAQFFFETIERLKNTMSYPKDPLQFFNFIIKNISYQGKLGTFKNYFELYDFQYQNAIKDFRNLFKSTVFKNELKWFLHILDYSRKIRFNNPVFILDFVNKDYQLSRSFKKVLKKIGTPFFLNSNNFGGFILPNNMGDVPLQVYILLAASELLFNAYGKKDCGLYDFCKKNYIENDPTNEKCLQNPFLKINEPKACPFSQLLKAWGLHERMYTKHKHKKNENT